MFNFLVIRNFLIISVCYGLYTNLIYATEAYDARKAFNSHTLFENNSNITTTVSPLPGRTPDGENYFITTSDQEDVTD